MGYMREAGGRARVTVIRALLNDPIQESEYRRAFAAMVTDRRDALIVSDHGEGLADRGLIVELAARARLPAIYSYRRFVEAGGLMAYGADDVEPLRVIVDYINSILKGANPGELPFQQPTTFTLDVNLATAKTLRSLDSAPPAAAGWSLEDYSVAVRFWPAFLIRTS